MFLMNILLFPGGGWNESKLAATVIDGGVAIVGGVEELLLQVDVGRITILSPENAMDDAVPILDTDVAGLTIVGGGVVYRLSLLLARLMSHVEAIVGGVIGIIGLRRMSTLRINILLRWGVPFTDSPMLIGGD